MDVRIVAFDSEFSSPDGKNKSATTESVELAGNSVIKTLESDALSTVRSGEYCHVLNSNTIVLPGFYEAMVTACEYANADYVFCICARLLKTSGTPDKVIPTPDDFAIGQIVVRGWVLREIGDTDINAVLSRVLSQYRGVEVPHVLCLEVG